MKELVAVLTMGALWPHLQRMSREPAKLTTTQPENWSDGEWREYLQRESLRAGQAMADLAVIAPPAFDPLPFGETRQIRRARERRERKQAQQTIERFK